MERPSSTPRRHEQTKNTVRSKREAVQHRKVLTRKALVGMIYFLVQNLDTLAPLIDRYYRAWLRERANKKGVVQ